MFDLELLIVREQYNLPRCVHKAADCNMYSPLLLRVRAVLAVTAAGTALGLLLGHQITIFQNREEGGHENALRLAALPPVFTSSLRL